MSVVRLVCPITGVNDDVRTVDAQPSKRLIGYLGLRTDLQRDQCARVQLAEAREERRAVGGGDIPFDHASNVGSQRRARKAMDHERE